MKMLFALICLMTITPPLSFKDNQMKFQRVKQAYDEKWAAIYNDLKIAKLEKGFDMLITAYKREGVLEIWTKPKTATAKQYKLFKSYPFCAKSGKLGPKVREGDLQTPEGFYKINVFNPESLYHLSLGINYPNKVDLARTGKDNRPGNDIYIHGNCVTVGCIPLSDDKIKEVYVLAVEATSGGQVDIPVYIFPFKMTEDKMKLFSPAYPNAVELWKNLQVGYQKFKREKSVVEFTETNGKYVISD